MTFGKCKNAMGRLDFSRKGLDQANYWHTKEFVHMKGPHYIPSFAKLMEDNLYSNGEVWEKDQVNVKEKRDSFGDIREALDGISHTVASHGYAMGADQFLEVDLDAARWWAAAWAFNEARGMLPDLDDKGLPKAANSHEGVAREQMLARKGAFGRRVGSRGTWSWEKANEAVAAWNAVQARLRTAAASAPADSWNAPSRPVQKPEKERAIPGKPVLPLPPGWLGHYCSQTRRYFYQNIHTSVTQWEIPEGPAQPLCYLTRPRGNTCT